MLMQGAFIAETGVKDFRIPFVSKLPADGFNMVLVKDFETHKAVGDYRKDKGWFVGVSPMLRYFVLVFTVSTLVVSRNKKRKASCKSKGENTSVKGSRTAKLLSATFG